MTDWETWAAGVLNGIAAPIDLANVDTLWAWSGAESLPRDRMSWLNPLNATWYMPGATPMNSIPVWAYVTRQDGIDATVQTLLGGPSWPDPFPQYYPVILANLRGSIPRGSWGNACPNLGTWGTGCGWLQSTYGPVPGNLGADDMTPEQDAKLTEILAELRGTGRFANIDRIAAALGIASPDSADPATIATTAQLSQAVTELKAAVAAAPAGAVDLTPVLQAIKTLTLKAA